MERAPAFYIFTHAHDHALAHARNPEGGKMMKLDIQKTKTTYFDHEKLHAYQYSIHFVGLCEELLGKIPKKFSVHDQLDRASTSIALNIAEGNGRFHINDRCRYLDLAVALLWNVQLV